MSITNPNAAWHAPSHRPRHFHGMEKKWDEIDEGLSGDGW